MKKRLQLSLLLCLAALMTFSQTTLPQNPGKLPAPKNLQVVAKPDLIITNVTVVSATGGVSADWDIRLSVTVKNTGGIITPATKFKATAKSAAAGNNPWKDFGYADCPKVGPGQTITTEIRLRDNNWAMHKVPKFNLVLKADGTNLVAEGSENNNSTTGILIGL